MTLLLPALQVLTLVLLAWALIRLRAARTLDARRAQVVSRLQERVAGLDMRIAPRIRDIVAHSRRAEGHMIPNVHFVDLDTTVPVVFSTDNVLTLGKFVCADISTMCHGEGTCGLCRVQVTEGLEHVGAPSENEQLLLRAYGDADPSLRLACHLRPRGDIAIHCCDSPKYTR